MAGDAWVGEGTTPPPSLMLEEAAPGEIDPVYGFPTGIARDADGNALGGIRLPDLAVGREPCISSNLSGDFLSGLFVDLACTPAPGHPPVELRLSGHGAYVAAVARQSRALRKAGYLLPDDATALTRAAAGSEVGKPGSCDA